MTTETLTLLKAQKPFAQTKGQDVDQTSARSDKAFSNHLKLDRAPIERAERSPIKSSEPSPRDAKDTNQRRTEDRRNDTHDRSERVKAKSKNHQQQDPRKLDQRNQTDRTQETSDQKQITEGEETNTAQATSEKEGIKNQEAESNQENQEHPEVNTFTDLTLQTAETAQDGSEQILEQSKETNDNPNTTETPTANPLTNLTDLQKNTDDTKADSTNLTAKQTTNPSLKNLAGKNTSPLGEHLTTGSDGVEGEETEGKSLLPNKDVSEIAKTSKDGSVIREAAKALGANNQTTNTPILTNAAQGAGNFFKTATFSPVSAEGAISQTTESLDGVNGTTNTIDNKGTTATSSLRGPSYANTTQSIALTIAQKAQNGVQQFEIRLNPPELGRVDVRLEFGKDGQVTTHLIVERPETLEMLNKDSRQLARALEEAGLKLDNDGLSFSLQDQGNAENQLSKESNDKAQHNDAESSQTNSEEAENASPLRRMLNPAGLDIHI